MSSEIQDQFLTALVAWNVPTFHFLGIQSIWHILASVVNKKADGKLASDCFLWVG